MIAHEVAGGAYVVTAIAQNVPTARSAYVVVLHVAQSRFP